MNGREKWIQALRSGDYKQGRKQLSQFDSYCCLGVACDLAIKEEIILSFSGSEGHLRSYPKVQEWIGLGSPGTNYALAALNDDGFSFDQIADLLEHLSNDEIRNLNV